MDENQAIVEPGFTASFSNEGFVSDNGAAETSNESSNVGEDLRNDSVDPARRLRKKRVSSDRRFDQLIYERGLLEQQNLVKDSVLAEQAKELERLRTQVQEREQESNSYYESAVGAKEESILRELKHAREEGDVDKEVGLVNLLTELKAEKKANLAFNIHQKRLREMQEAHEDYNPIETPLIKPSSAPSQDNLPDAFHDWAEDNPWYEQNPQLRDEANQIAQDLMKQLAFQKQSHLIGTPGFYQSITELMAPRYGGGRVKESPQRSYEERYDEGYEPVYQPVAPVNRRGPSMADQYLSNRGPNAPVAQGLTKEEYAIARHLPVKPGESTADLVKRYAKGKNYPKSPLPGGTPDRLTIL